jgi:hypothetical protein
MNRNANQTIDFRSVKLLAAMRALESMKDLDVNKLDDGVYSIDAEMYKSNMSALSMSNGALDNPATLTIKDGKAALSVHLKPTYQYFIWGHLEDFCLWNGSTLNEAFANANAGSYDASLTTKAEYSRFYRHSYNGGEVTYRMDVEEVDGYSVDYPYPGTVTFDLPYRGIDDNSSMYLCYMSVDAMEKGASALLNLKWNTLQAIETTTTLFLDTDAVSLIEGGAHSAQTVKAEVPTADSYTITWRSSNEAVATVANGTITAVSAGACTVTATASKQGAPDLTKTVTVTVAAADSAPVRVDAVTVENGVATATVTGDVLVTNGGTGDAVQVATGAVAIDATSGNAPAGITAAKVLIPDAAAKALSGKSVSIATDMGDIKLTSPAVAQIANGLASGDQATLRVAKSDAPAALEAGEYSAYYDISLTNAAGVSLAFDNGEVTISVPCSDDSVKYAYHIQNGKRAERQSVTWAGGRATWTAKHFSLWALSAREYEIAAGDGNTGTDTNPPGDIKDDGFFLSDGNYYVNIALWHASANQASMGDVAFANNRQALVTVANGKVTTVRVATNPVNVTKVMSAIIDFKVPGSSVKVLETAPITTEPAGNKYNYIKLAEFTMPASGQPSVRSEVTYVDVEFKVPDTPMDAIPELVQTGLTARLRFSWSSAQSTGDSALNADNSIASGTSSLDVANAPAASLTDSATGIKLTAPDGTIPTDAELKVTLIASGADFTKAEAALKEALGAEDTPKFKLYDISLIQSKVAIQPNGTVTLSVPIPSDYDKAKVVFYRINDDGTATLIKGKVSGGNYEVSLSRLALYALVEGREAVNDLAAAGDIGRFTDITGHWAIEAIRFAVESGLFNGTSETTFSPNLAMDRGMFVTVLGRLAGIDAAAHTATPFADVKAGAYYAPYAAWAAENNIAEGIGGGLFAPGNQITRQEMATVLNRYISFAKITLESNAQEAFADDAAIASWAKDSVYTLAYAGLINGVGEGNYAPARTATRAEVATLLMRFAQNYAN